MYRMYKFAVLLGVMLFAIPAVAEQQPFCSERDNVIKRLASEYSEVPVAMGLANNGGVIEVLAGKEGETWTILVTMPNGVACLIAAGQHWEAIQSLAYGLDS